MVKPSDLFHDSSCQRLDFSSAGRLLHRLLDELGEEDPPAGFPQIRGYILSRALGSGGGGQVFQGVREGSERSLAIKVLNRSVSNRAATDRAWRELDMLTGLHLASVPPVHDYGIHEGRMFIVTDHVEGLTLDDHCRKVALDRRARVELLAQVADAVQSLHEHGVIHRDIKPDNIIIANDGRPMIIDFGIASLLSDDVSESLTEEGTPIGTVAYMSPEQARGDRKQMSTRSDVYSLGAMACGLLTGKTPHDAGGALLEALRRVAQDPPRDPLTLDPELPKPLARILGRATSPAPEDRYPSAAALAEDFRRWLRDEPIEWQRPSWWRRQMLTIRRNPRAFAAKTGVWFVVIVLALTSAVGLANWRSEHQNAERISGLQKETHEAQKKAEDALMQADLERIQFLQQQLDIGEALLKEGSLTDAAVGLMLSDEHIQRYHADDPELRDYFHRNMQALIQRALAQPKPAEQ